MRSANSSLTLTRIAACTLVAVAMLSACGSKDSAQAGPGAARTSVQGAHFQIMSAQDALEKGSIGQVGRTHFGIRA